MRIVCTLLVPFLLSLSACGGTPDEEAKSAGPGKTATEKKSAKDGPTVLTIPATKEVDGWLVFESPIEVKQTDMPGNDSPEAAAVHFYASLMRGDDKHKEVVPSGDKADRVNRALEEYAGWKFTSFKLLKKKAQGDAVGFGIELQIEVDGDTDGGEDDLTVEKIDGKWYVTEPPR